MARTTKSPKTKQVHMLLSEDDYTKLTELSETFDMSKGQVIREALKVYSEMLENQGALQIRLNRIARTE